MKRHGRMIPWARKNKAPRTKHTREIAEFYFADGGVVPLTVMVENMRFWHHAANMVTNRLGQLVSEIDVSDIQRRNSRYRGLLDLMDRLLESRTLAQDCARDAAPYFHPRLASVTLRGDNSSPIPIEVVKSMTAKEAAEAYAQTLQELNAPGIT